MTSFSDIVTPIGPFRVMTEGDHVVAAGFYPERNAKLGRFGLIGREAESSLSRRAAGQLEEYFAGQRKAFDLPVSFAGMSPFARTVLDCLYGVPYGQVLTYGSLAALSGHPHAARAVGRVMAANPVPVIVPCHRIVGSGGKMTGYSGGDGIPTKEWLLAFEADYRVS